MMSIKTLLVGAYFRPPAPTVLSFLPSGTLLTLEREEDNKYDPFAIAVWGSPRDVPPELHEEFAARLAGVGFTLEEILEEEKIHLGYVAKSGGNPIKNTPYTGNREILEQIPQLGTGRLEVEGNQYIVVIDGEIDNDEQ